MTPAQLSALKAAILAETDPIVTDALALGAMGRISEFYNELASPEFIVWRTSVPVEEYRDAMVWTEVDALTAGKARIWEWLTARMTLPVAASQAAVRQGIADAFGAGTTTRANLLAVAKRSATKAEKILATGTGSDASPADLGWEGKLSYLDVKAALES